MTFGFALRAGFHLGDNLIHVSTPRINLCHAATNSCTNYVDLPQFSLQCTEKGTNKTLIYTHIYSKISHNLMRPLHCGLPVAHAAVAVFECAQKRRRCHINASYIVQARHPMFQDCGCSSNCVFLCICRAKSSELLQAISESTIPISGGGTWFQEKPMGARSIGVPAS